MQIARIPAPTGDEGRRAEAIAQMLRDGGIEPEIDSMGNVIGTAGGKTRGEDVALVAHLDTVFPIDTPLDICRVGDRLTGPGIGDNSLAIAAMLWQARRLRAGALERGVLLAATVGEEGLGDLRGARALALERRMAVAIVIEGHMLGRVIHAGIGSRRFAIMGAGPGGHSWEDFGAPNAIHVLLHAGAVLTGIPLPSDPKTTLSIGVIEGGRSVNTIPDRAAMLVDTRSLSEEHLAQVEEAVRLAVREAARETGIETNIERIGQRPAVVLDPDHPVVAVAERVLRDLGIEPRRDSASTDANALLAAGIPSVCIGTGGNMHRLDEWISIESIRRGLQQLDALVYSLSGKEVPR